MSHRSVVADQPPTLVDINNSTVAPPGYTHTDLTALLKSAQDRCTSLIAECGGDEGAAVARMLTPQPQKGTSSFGYGDLLKIQAPMVRCSRPPFRHLCRLWGTDISYTHMIMADSFVRSADARASDFALFEGESRLITQFAAKDGPLLAQAAQIVAPYCDAIDINCGCPQKWAIAEGVGSALLEHPETIADMVRSVHNIGGGVTIPCVVKIRVFDDLSRTVELARRAEAMGAAWVTVHGRTPKCTSGSPVRPSAIRLVKESLGVPVVANGGVVDPTTAATLAVESGGLGGVMCAQGLLDNPSCFYHAGFHDSPYTDAVLDHSRAAFYPVGGASYEDSDASEYAKVLHQPLFHPLLTTPMTSVDHGVGVPNTDGAHTEGSGPRVGQAGPPPPPMEAISDFARLAVACNLPLKATQHHLALMTHRLLSPSERLYMGEQPCILGTLRCLHNRGILVSGGFYQ